MTGLVRRRWADTLSPHRSKGSDHSPMNHPALILAILALAGCTSGPDMPELARMETPGQIATRDASGPPDAAPGTCWGRDETPTRLQTVTENVVVKEPVRDADGTVLIPAEMRSQTRQEIVEERRELWFETPCPESFTPDIIASLQRALKARGYHEGEITGELDTTTRAAIRAYQQPQGLNSSVLSLTAARQLGLVAVEIPSAS